MAVESCFFSLQPCLPKTAQSLIFVLSIQPSLIESLTELYHGKKSLSRNNFFSGAVAANIIEPCTV